MARKESKVTFSHAPAIKEVHILWITAGLSCDGDTVSVTAALQPSIEDVRDEPQDLGASNHA